MGIGFYILALPMYPHINSSPIYKETIATVTAQGQVTLPAEVRKHLDLKKNSKVAFVIEPEGEVKVTTPQYQDIASLRGVAGSLSQPLSWREMKQIAQEDRFKNKYSK